MGTKLMASIAAYLTLFTSARGQRREKVKEHGTLTREEINDIRWIKLMDPATGDAYYNILGTSYTTWEMPVGVNILFNPDDDTGDAVTASTAISTTCSKLNALVF